MNSYNTKGVKPSMIKTMATKKQRTAKTMRQLLFILVLSGALVFLSLGVILDFTISISNFWLTAVVTWLSLAVIVGFIYLLIGNTDVFQLRKNSETYVYVIMLSCLFLSVACVKFINFNAIPFLLPTLFFLPLGKKSSVIILNIFFFIVLILFYTLISVFYDIPDLAATISTSVLFCFSSLLLVCVVDVNKPRVHLIFNTALAGVVQYMLSNVLLLFMFELTDALTASLWILLGVAFSIAIYMSLMPFVESMFKIGTNGKLSEYCNFDTPLLRRLAKEAPGTFNHSLVVGNLSEACAAALGENTLLARAGAYYHDVGKLASPQYFGENNSDGYNPHDELIPEVSVSMITKHTHYGYELILQAGMPVEIADIAEQHHGNSLVAYFYNKAQNMMETKLPTDNYRYSNIKPQTKIAAIVMFTDTIEAASRANYAKLDFNGICTLINNLMKSKIDEGQLDECPITMDEIRIIRETIINALPGIYHKRVSYANKKGQQGK